MFDVVVRHVTCSDLSRHHPDQAPEEEESSSQAQADHPPHLGTTSRLYHICVIILCHNVIDDMMLHMVCSVYCLLSPCPAGCSWRRGRGGCRGGTGRGRRSWAARAAPAAAATCCQFLLQGTGEVYWGNGKYSVFIRELQVFTIMEKAPTRAFSW